MDDDTQLNTGTVDSSGQNQASEQAGSIDPSNSLKIRLKPKSSYSETDQMKILASEAGDERDLGEDDEETATETDSDGGMPPAARASMGDTSGMGVGSMYMSRNASTDHFDDTAEQPKRRKAPRSGSISLKLLLDEGIVKAGDGVLSMEYKNVSHTADLLDDGKIRINMDGEIMVFDSPSAFSIYLKRLVNPSRKADDGWKSVRYEGRLLEEYKLELARRTFGIDSSHAGESSYHRSKRSRLGPQDPEPPSSPPREHRTRKADSKELGIDDKPYIIETEVYPDGLQPFGLVVSPFAEAIIDFHSHLCYNEVSGLLLGKLDGVAKTIEVLTAMPIESKAEIDGPTACLLMDEEDRNRKVNKVTGKDGALKVVGWYHSHPSFPARPTTIDIYNQVLEQQQASPEEGFPVTPFVGAIVSPYDDTEPKKDIAEIFWYYAELPTSFEGVAQGQSPVNSGVIPRALKSQVYLGDKNDTEDLNSLQKTVEHLAKSYAQLTDGINIEGLWRRDNTGRVILRLRKIIHSFEEKLAKGVFDGKLRSFTRFKLEVLVRAVWSVYGRSINGIKQQNSLGIIENVEGSIDQPPSEARGAVSTEKHTAALSHQNDGASDDEPISDDDELTE